MHSVLIRAAKVVRPAALALTKKPPPTIHNEQALATLSIPRAPPSANIATDSELRSQQIADAVKAEHELAETIKSTSVELKNKLTNVLSRHLAREQRRKEAHDNLKAQLWSKVVQTYISFQEEEEFPMEMRILERASLRRLIAQYYEFWCVRSTHVYTEHALQLFCDNLDEHAHEINDLPEDERERDISSLVELYINQSSSEKVEDLLHDHPFCDEEPEDQLKNDDDEDGTSIGENRENEVDEKTIAEMVQILDDEDKGTQLAQKVKTTAIAKGLENARESAFTLFVEQLKNYTPQLE
ncbi:uncharacterized protein MONOS_9462 [Monocercomonoides exilis]|uniref:uncharacterized protein n=1 Tax=Monocercomonoides exilis TaxID=2049356 RepID=UPI00355A9ADE|nr:hypothetical protein MONOS_9462 [Monocercomonoides exilis]|eukprot:MONOS_9462.1-p1 / transcript=MONOS_9462.1 / gene=MONOS_9462 / organism=Monocercomonoides_exilis_PA203 / gene_product=unspecified product / transcript_product=unspecified product / location=Mono_scaffold00392:4511-6025(-) / protein_length=298 / sequence_SO=supercontig / SO=protein_coding / is_pseudo=false